MRTFLLGALLVLAHAAQAAPKKPAKAAAKRVVPAKKSEVPQVKLKSPEGAVDADAASSSGPAPAATRGPTRIDFDDRLIQGQTNKAGAVYLYDRKELKTRSMVKKRENFRDEIIGSLYDS